MSKFVKDDATHTPPSPTPILISLQHSLTLIAEFDIALEGVEGIYFYDVPTCVGLYMYVLQLDDWTVSKTCSYL